MSARARIWACSDGRYSPSVFQTWFVQTWPEPSAWLAARMAYSRTLAVMSMIGHVLGWVCCLKWRSVANARLGDRHGENILFDSITGDTVHVDLNCLFEKVSFGREAEAWNEVNVLVLTGRARHLRSRRRCRSA